MRELLLAFVVATSFNVLADTDSFSIEYKNIDTHYGTKTKLFVTSHFDDVTINKVEVNRGNCPLAWPKAPKVTVNKNKYSQSDELLNNLSNPDYNPNKGASKPQGTTWHSYEPVRLTFGQTTGYVTTTVCKIIEITISSSEGDYRFTN
jgi:hypothetical protein